MSFEEMRDELIKKLTVSSWLRLFKDLLEKNWRNYASIPGFPSVDKNFIEWIEWVSQKPHNHLILDSFLSLIYGIRKFESPTPLYLAFLEEVESVIKSIFVKNRYYVAVNEILQEEREKQSENQQKNAARSIDFLVSRYFEAVGEIVKEGYNFDDSHKEGARISVLKAILYIGKEIRETDKEGTEELTSRIKSDPDYWKNPTLTTALEIMDSWADWMDKDHFEREHGHVMTKNSIKRAIMKRMSSAHIAYIIPFARSIYAPNYVPNFVKVWRRNSNGRMEEVFNIKTLRDNPHLYDYSKDDVSVGSIVKICDGEERFWVKVKEIGNNHLKGLGFSVYFGTIMNDLICDNGYDKGDVVEFNLEQIWDVEKPATLGLARFHSSKDEDTPIKVYGTPVEPESDLIFGVKKEEFINILNECSEELKLKGSRLGDAIILIIRMLATGRCVNQIINELTISKPVGLYCYHLGNIVRTSEVDTIAADIMKEIRDGKKKTFHLRKIFSNNLSFLKNEIVMRILRDLACTLDKSEDTFKPGDKVFFIKHNIHGKGNEPYKMNLYLAIITGWQANLSGGAYCKFENSFSLMNLETLSLDVCDSDDVKQLIESEDFSKALVKSDIQAVSGDITLCPVDESLFPKLNKILAKV